ncbi:hypothetical protein I4U23_000673 [Adineta vaga]|nr:hypothetical protein I4U23_000673 [Adineta vaga]
MADDEQTRNAPLTTKTSKSRKYHILTDGRILEKPLTNDLHNNTSSKLPSLPTKSNVSPLKSESMQLSKPRKKSQNSLNKSSSFKIERQTTNIISKTRLPTLQSISTDSEQKLQSEYQRRQIYALNHLMRELEQEKFREFCKLNGISAENIEEVVPSINEDSIEPSSI